MMEHVDEMMDEGETPQPPLMAAAEGPAKAWDAAPAEPVEPAEPVGASEDAELDGEDPYVMRPQERPGAAPPAEEEGWDEAEVEEPPPSRGSAPQEEAKAAYWRSVLTGDTETVPDEVRRRAGVEDISQTEEQRDYRLCSTVNRSWAVDHLGLDREQVRTQWPRLRGELAARYRVADDERELFTALSAETQDAPRRAVAQAVYEKAFRDAVLGHEDVEAIGIAPGAEARAFPFASELASGARHRGEELRRRYLPLAQELAEGLDFFAGLEEEAFSAPRVLDAVPELARSLEALEEMEPRERRFIYAMAQGEILRRRESEPLPESLFARMRRSTRRGATGLGLGLGQTVANAAVAGMNSLGELLGEEWGHPLREAAEGLDRKARLFEEFRRFLQDEVQPLELRAESGLAAQLAVDAAGAAPAAVLACSGGAGFAALAGSGVGESVAAARQRAPEGKQWLQYMAGVLGGGIQAGIYSGMGRVGGQLLSNAVSRFARASGSGAAGYSLAALNTMGAAAFEQAKLFFASKAAQAADLASHEIAARLGRTASNIDWEAYGDNATDLEMNMREAAMTLPFILIGSGRVALRHFRSRHAVLGEGERLLDWGIPEEKRDAVMNERHPDRQGELLREALCGSKRWSAPGFIVEAMRALRLLNSDYYQGFKDPQVVADFLQLPSEGGLVPRPPFVHYEAGNPAHMNTLLERHGVGTRANANRLELALQLWDEWWQKAHLVQPAAAAEGALPTQARRARYGLDLMSLGGQVPRRMRAGGFYAPQAEAERAALLRDRVAELHDLSYQLLLSTHSLDSLSRGYRNPERMRADGERARQAMLEAVARCVMERVGGKGEQEALDALGASINQYYKRRKYSDFPPDWMGQVQTRILKSLDSFARGSAGQAVEELPPELVDACRVCLGFQSCASALYELLPITPDFQTALSRGMSHAEAYEHLLTRELGVDFSRSKLLKPVAAPRSGGEGGGAASQRNAEGYEAYRQLTGHALESSPGEGGQLYWRLRRPNGSYTRWHSGQEHAVNDMVANTAFSFMPFGAAEAGASAFSAYDNLCSIALRETARSWLECAPYARPGFELGQLRQRVYSSGARSLPAFLAEEGMRAPSGSFTLDAYSLATPLQLAQARFRTYWWRALNAGLLPAEEAGAELVRLGVLEEAERRRVMDIAQPPPMPKNPDVPLKLTPPPDIAGRNRALAAHLTDFSLRYFVSHLDEMPLPPSAREWFRLAPLCPVEGAGEAAGEGAKARRLSLAHGGRELTAYANRLAVQELRSLAPAVEQLRLTEAQGLLGTSSLLPELHRALGMSGALQAEQAWCMNQSGAGAFMAADEAFWRLLEEPLAGWQALGEAGQTALRSHVEALCRTELPPDALEAEARGEQPDYVLTSLHNLAEVLRDYPELHEYGLAHEASGTHLRRLELTGRPGMGGEGAQQAFAEPAYELLPLYTGGSMERGFRLGAPQELPESMQGDTRLMPALHLLGALRSYPGSRPFARREGIQWRGALYGGSGGRRPQGLGEDWEPQAPLTPLVDMLGRVDALRATLPVGAELRQLGESLEGLGGELGDMSPLLNVTLYRSRSKPAQLCRLMPGELNADEPAARSPYVTHTLAGVYMHGLGAVQGAEAMSRALVPLEQFRPAPPRFGMPGSLEARSRKALAATLGSVLERASAGGEAEVGGAPGMRELLLRLVDDSGFGESLRGADPRELTYGQVLTLKLARELLLCVCGREPQAAQQRLAALAARLQADEDMRGAALRALFSAAMEAYRKGSSPIGERTPRPRQEKKGSYRPGPQVRKADLKALMDWEAQHEKELLDSADIRLERRGEDGGYGADGGYMKGFADD